MVRNVAQTAEKRPAWWLVSAQCHSTKGDITYKDHGHVHISAVLRQELVVECLCDSPIRPPEALFRIGDFAIGNSRFLQEVEQLLQHAEYIADMVWYE